MVNPISMGKIVSAKVLVVTGHRVRSESGGWKRIVIFGKLLTSGVPFSKFTAKATNDIDIVRW